MTARRRRPPRRERAAWALINEEEREAACLRRKLPVTTGIEDMLKFEYRRGMQVAVLAADDDKLKKIARRILARHKNGGSE